MTNKELMGLMDKFVESQDDTHEDEWYTTDKGFAGGVMDWFKDFLKSEGYRIKED